MRTDAEVYSDSNFLWLLGLMVPEVDLFDRDAARPLPWYLYRVRIYSRSATAIRRT